MSNNTFDVFTFMRGVRAARLSTNAKTTLLILATYANDKGMASVTQTTLAENTGLHPATLTRHLKAARQAGWVVVTKTPNQAATYTLTIPEAP